MADSTAKPASPAGAPTAPAAPAPITSIDDLIERAEDRLIPKGSTVRLSPDHPDLQSKARVDELEDSLEACGIKIVWDKNGAKDAIAVDAPAKSPATATAAASAPNQAAKQPPKK